MTCFHGSRTSAALRFAGGLALAAFLALPARAAAGIELGNAAFRYVVSEEGRNLEFTDLASGRNLLRTNAPSFVAAIRRGEKEFQVSRVRREENRIRLSFGESGVEAGLKVESSPAGVVLSVESVPAEVASIRFLNLPLDLQGLPTEVFGACVLSLNLITRVDALPVLQRDLQASAEAKFGMVGARVAIVAGPMGGMLEKLRTLLSTSSELPRCNVAGPWAPDVPFSHGSYLFNFGTLVETNVTDWIESVRRVGFSQIDNHGGGSFFRFGDFELDRTKWPEGWDTFGRIVGRLHAEGIGSIFHTYAFFIDKRSKYVTPVPDRRLDAFRKFTLAEPVDATATEIVVNESTANLSTLTGFFEHNSIVLHVDDELVTFSGFSKEPPWRITGLKRGAHETKASAHARGAEARHLKECFGLFVPNPESSLFEEIAANHADVVNRCGFDGLYLDAIDGSSILRGPDECWYWANKFVVEIQKRLKKPVGMEMSAMWHHFWQYRTRWQAWDVPRRGHERFVDIHADSVNGGLMLPLHLGWWELFTYDPPQVEPSYPEVMEHLGARLIGWNAGISLTAGMDRRALQRTPLFARAAEILRTCEEARRSSRFDEATRSRLRDPARRFAMVRETDGNVGFREMMSLSRTVAASEPWTSAWSVTNAFERQPARFRIEALAAVTNRLDGVGVRLADWAHEPATAWKQSAAPGVEFVSGLGTNLAAGWAVLGARCTGRVERRGAWAKWEKRFDPVLDAKNGKALVVEVEGDGSGALLALRLESPQHLGYGAIADRYIPLDFTGRRKFTLVETESTRWSDYAWNDGKHPYGVYREVVQFGALESVSIWLQNLPADREVRVGLGPITAVPLLSVAVLNPRIRLGDRTVEFPVALASGSWIEANGPAECTVFGPKGESLGSVTPRGDWPEFSAGENRLAFEFNGEASPSARAKVTSFVRAGK